MAIEFVKFWSIKVHCFSADTRAQNSDFSLAIFLLFIPQQNVLCIYIFYDSILILKCNHISVNSTNMFQLWDNFSLYSFNFLLFCFISQLSYSDYVFAMSKLGVGAVTDNLGIFQVRNVVKEIMFFREFQSGLQTKV